MNSSPEKPRIEIEAPSKEQIAAARKMRREQEMPHYKAPDETIKKQRRFGIEGVILMLLAVALLYFLHPLGMIAWILALMPFLGGILVMLKGWQ